MLKRILKISNNNELFKIFHSKTKINSEKKNITQKIIDNKTPLFKSYPRFNEIRLMHNNLPKVQLQKALMSRSSVRKFSQKKVSFKKISLLMYWSFGLNFYNYNYYNNYNRFYPSAGATYPLEIYLISLNSCLESGIYHYYVKHNSLEKIFEFKKIFLIKKIKYVFFQDWIGDSSIILIITSIFERTTKKYGNRGYRYVLIEAGHLGQNIYLVSQSLGIHCCAICGFKDTELEKLIEIDGEKESVIYAFALGYKK